MSREPIPTWCFALVVVRLGHRFLVVHERKHGQGWYLPAGRVEPGETFAAAAVRETREEAGIAIALNGVVMVQHSPRVDGARIRVVFVGHPVDDRPPKTIPDDDSLEAAWVTLAELDRLPLRGDEVREWFAYVAGGGSIYPLAVLADV
ncbi:MAG TPA: NUDIX hydrolase [Kofleriaceae bacterium]|nr:NUDIX hydrolase [Kofleriaceae bacterium]